MTEPVKRSGQRAELKMTLALGSAVIAAVAIAIATTRTSHGADPRPEDPTPAAVLSAPIDTPSPDDGAALTGEVLETVPVSKYTYLRLRTADGEAWAAVPSAAVAVGSRVAIINATRMDDFKSTTLRRTFGLIYFGTLGTSPGRETTAKFSPIDVPQLDDDPTLPPGHPDLGSAAALGSVAGDEPLPPGHPDIGTASPHAGIADNANDPPISAREVAPAQGSTAHVISELRAQRLKLAGHRVRVRGEVTKVTPDVNGRAFFHLRDGSVSNGGPNAAEPAPDLVATAVVPPQRGQIAVFEGTLRSDVDVGIGYEYPALLEDATIVGE